MKYDLEKVQSIEMDHQNDVITVLADGKKHTFTKDEIAKVSLKSAGWVEDSKDGTKQTAYFENARCSIDRENKEIVCGD